MFMPAAYMANYYPDCVIAIANIQEGDRLAPSSNYGRLVKLAAPVSETIPSGSKPLLAI